MQLAVDEVRHGLALLCGEAATKAASAAMSHLSTTHQQSSPEGLDAFGLATEAAVSLLAFPNLLEVSQPESNRTGGLIRSAGLYESTPMKILQALSSASVGNPSHSSSNLPTSEDLARMSGASAAAAYATRLHTLRVALHASSRERLILSSPCKSSSAPLSRLEPLWSQLYSAWEGLKAFEEARAAEEAEVYKTKVKTTVIGTEEEDDEADFKKRNPDPW